MSCFTTRSVKASAKDLFHLRQSQLKDKLRSKMQRCDFDGNSIMEQRIKILFIDDESHNRHAFFANFKRIYEIYLCASAIEELEFLKTHVVDIVITDRKMPYMTGVEFLDVLREITDPIRIVITAHRDTTPLEMALKEGKIHSYI